MNEAEFKRRTLEAGLAALKLCERLPRGIASDAISRQLVRSATSVGANYRAACRARSRRDMHAKLGIVEEEADESLYWIEVLVSGGYSPESAVAELRDEFSQILAMVVSSRKTLQVKIAREADQSKIENRKSKIIAS